MLGFEQVRRQGTRLFLCCVSVFVTYPVSAAHPFHETHAQFEHNVHNSTLEFALRIDAIDFEQMVERWLADRINLETDPRAEQSIELWLGERLNAQLSTGEQSAMTWIGFEFEGAFCWVYLEFEAPPEAEWLDLTHLVLFDWHPQPTNNIVGVGRNKGESYATTIQQPIARIRLATDAEKESRAWWWALADLAAAIWQAIRSRVGEI